MLLTSNKKSFQFFPSFFFCFNFASFTFLFERSERTAVVESDVSGIGGTKVPHIFRLSGNDSIRGRINYSKA